MPSEHTKSVQVQGEQRPAVGRAGRPPHTHYHVLVRKNGLSSFSDTIVVFWLLLASLSFFLCYSLCHSVCFLVSSNQVVGGRFNYRYLAEVAHCFLLFMSLFRKLFAIKGLFFQGHSCSCSVGLPTELVTKR